MFTDEVAREITEVAREFGLEPAALLAIAEVESSGRTFAIVNGRPEPLIRFEGHYFDRLLSAQNRARARAENLASPTAGAIANPASQAARWRLVEQASGIDREAALESVSWGLGQVMGSHWAWLGFAGIDDLVAEARLGAAGQARLMARYLDRSGLTKAMAARDWEAVARGYNGPSYRKSAYHLKLGAVYRRHTATGGKPHTPDARPALLRRGSTGNSVRDLQQTLSALGYPVKADGMFGPATERAVRAFQRDHRLAVDGTAGPATLRAITRALQLGAPTSGFWTRLLSWFRRLWD